MLRVVADDKTSAEMGSALDELVREGARRMLAAALEAEVDAYVCALDDEVDEYGKRLVVRNGHAQPQNLLTGAGAVEVIAPRVNDHTQVVMVTPRRISPDARLPQVIDAWLFALGATKPSLRTLAAYRADVEGVAGRIDTEGAAVLGLEDPAKGSRRV